MNLYRISQTENDGYDTFDSAVVAAESEEEAKRIHPNGSENVWNKFGTWASSPDQVKVELIGMAAPSTKKGAICASFNAG